MQNPGLLLAAETQIFPDDLFCLFENLNHLCIRFLEAASLLFGEVIFICNLPLF